MTRPPGEAPASSLPTSAAPGERPPRRRYVLALDSFKGSITAARACAAVAAGIRDADPAAEILERPMADGGEGTLAAFETAHPGARRMPITVTGPHGLGVAASWLFVPAAGRAGSLGVVELAGTSGIEFLAGRGLRPLDAHTLGFGQAIRAAIEHGANRLVLCIGSSASSDGGAGILSALGARLLTHDGVDAGLGVAALERVGVADTSRMLAPPAGGVAVVTDVRSPLTGPHGAAHVFGPQKGADAYQIERIDRALAHWAEVLRADPDLPGAGAAGGAGIALAMWGATLIPGAESVAGLIGLAESVAAADVVVTGEGSYDGQSVDAKVPAVVLELARHARARTALIAGRIGAPPQRFDVHVSLSDLARSPAAAMTAPAHWLREAGTLLARRAVPPGSRRPTASACPPASRS